MKPAKRFTALAACLLAFTMLCTGCSTITSVLGGIFQTHYETLEECFADPDIKEQVDAEVDAAMESNNTDGTYSAVQALAEGNTLIYDYTYADPIQWSDESEHRMWNNTFLEELASGKDQFEEVAETLGEELKIDGITIRLVYRNPDGTEVMSYDYANPPEPLYYATVEACMADPAVGVRFVDEFGFEDFTGTAYGEGNTLVYALTFVEPYVDGYYTAEDAVLDLTTYCENNSDAFTVDFQELCAVVDADPIAIRYDFFDTDGTQLYAHTFTSTAGDVTSESSFSAEAAVVPTTYGYATVADYLADETVASMLNEQLAAMSNDEFSVAVSAEGNTLIYNFTFSEAIDLSDESLRASVVSAFESGMEQQRSVFEGLADQIRAQVQGDDVAIRVVYNNADGSEIYAATFA